SGRFAIAEDKWNLPERPHSYPASFSILVIRLAASGHSPAPFRVACTVEGYIPVRKLARLGVQTGAWLNAWVKLTPSRTRRSRLGVFTYGFPSAPIVFHFC